MAFVITIKKTEVVRKLQPRQWLPGAGEGGGYGYAPEIEISATEETKVYEQAIESLDLAAVICAVNDIQGGAA